MCWQSWWWRCSNCLKFKTFFLFNWHETCSTTSSDCPAQNDPLRFTKYQKRSKFSLISSQMVMLSGQMKSGKVLTILWSLSSCKHLQPMAVRASLNINFSPINMRQLSSWCESGVFEQRNVEPERWISKKLWWSALFCWQTCIFQSKNMEEPKLPKCTKKLINEPLNKYAKIIYTK